MTIYNQISSNKWKTFYLICLFPIILAMLFIGTFFLIFYLGATKDAINVALSQTLYLSSLVLPILTIICIIWMMISWFTGDHIVLNSADAKEVSREDAPEIYTIVENVAITAGLPTPRVYIMEDQTLNAFATGRDPQHASIALTKGIIAKLDLAELEGVIAHEMSHIGNRDIRLTMIISTGIGVLTFLGQLLLRSAFSNRSKNGKGNIVLLVFGLILLIYGAFIAPFIMLALSRRREYQADATAAIITRNPEGLASALEKISGNSYIRAFEGKELASSACIAKALNKESFLSSLFSTHPPIEERIKILRNML